MPLAIDDFVIRLGLVGQGKTLIQTEKSLLPHLLSGVRVFSDYWVNWNRPNLILFDDFEQVAYERNCCVYFDEISEILDPRNWDSEDSSVRKFFTHHRKRHIEIQGTTQRLNLVAKTPLNQVSKFYVCTKTKGLLYDLLFPNYIFINEEEKTLNQIRHDENSIALDRKTSDTDDSEDDNFDIDFEDVSLESNSYWWHKSKLYHNELDEFKIEFLRHYCPQCKQRQDPKIEKMDSYAYADWDKRKKIWTPKPDRPIFYCPKHTDQVLDVVESPMYDTDYEVYTAQKEVVFRPYVKALKEVPYKGSLSPAQVVYKRALESPK